MKNEVFLLSDELEKVLNNRVFCSKEEMYKHIQKEEVLSFLNNQFNIDISFFSEDNRSKLEKYFLDCWNTDLVKGANSMMGMIDNALFVLSGFCLLYVRKDFSHFRKSKKVKK